MRVEALPAGAGGAHEEIAELLVAPGGEQGGALHRAHARADADRPEVVGDGLAHRVVGRERRELARVEAVGEAGLGQQRLGALRVVGIGRDRQGELLVPGHDVAGGAGEAERLGLVDRLAVHREARGQPHAPVRPRRAGRPLLREHQEQHAVGAHRGQRQPGGAPDVLRDGAVEEVGDVHLAALERGGARGLLGDASHHQALDARGLAPVAVEGLEGQLDARAGSSRTCTARPRPAPCGSPPRRPARSTSWARSRRPPRRSCRRRS